MKKIVFTLLTAFLMLPTVLLAQNEIVIGTGTASSTHPFYSFYDNSWCEIVYPANEITTTGNITALAWNCAEENMRLYSTLKIYMGTKSADTYSSPSDWTPLSDLTLVYDATNVVVGADTGWQTFTLDDPYYYDGSENLVVVVAKTMPPYQYSNTNFYYTSVPNTCLYRGGDSDVGFATYPGSAEGSLSLYRSNIKISFSSSEGYCYRPQNVVIENVTENSATMQWIDTNAVSWDIYLNEVQTDVPDSNTIPMDNVNVTSYNFSGLNAGTTYYAYVRANCDDYTASRWKGVSFNTFHVPAQLPYTCDFEDANENDNWTLIGNYTNKWFLGAAVNNTPDGQTGLYISNNNGFSNNYSNVTSTAWAYRDIDLDSAYSEYQISFDFKGVGENENYDNLRVYVGPPATPPATSSTSGACPPGAVEIGNFHNESDWIRPTIILNHTYSGVKRLYFLWWNDNGGGSSPAAAIDNLTVIGTTCGTPYNLDVSAITDSSATLTFHPALQNDNSWQALVVVHGDSLDESQAVSISDTTYEFGNLLSNTFYDIYLRTDCGGEYSLWSQPLEFRTSCSAFMDIPYSESFDSYGVGSDHFPLCWTKLANQTSRYPYISSMFVSSPGSLVFSSSATDSLYSCAIAPQVDVTANPINTLSVVFKILKASSPLGNGAIQVGVMTNPTDITTFTPVQTFTGYEWTNTNVWYDVEVPLTSYVGSGSYIALYVSDMATGATYIDNFSVYPTPSCERPSRITAVSTSTDVVDVSWVDDAGTMWDLCYGPTGFNPENPSDAFFVYDVMSTNYSVNGLTAGMIYDFYVRRNCGYDNVSPWVITPATATPYSVEIGVTGSSSITGCNLTIYDDGGMNGDYSAFCDYYLTIYPSDPDLVVSVSGTIQAESANFDYIIVYNDVCNDSTAANATQLYRSNQTSASDILTFGPIVSTTGPLTLFFHSDEGMQYSGFVVEATCVPGPDCRQPSNFVSTSSTASSVDLSWRENGYASAWSVAYGPSGFTPTDTSDMENVIDTIATIGGLTAGISYDFYVRADCSDGFSDWTGPVTLNPGTYNMPVSGTHSISMCDGTIFDDGGIINNYSNDCNSTLTIYPTDSNSYVSISGTFIGENLLDYLSVYQGTTVDENHLIQKINSSQSSPTVTFGPFTSESGPLTLYFYSDHSDTYAGFAINVNCVAAPSCRTPFDVIAQNVMTTDATIEWSMNSSSYVGFNVAISTTANFNPDTCTNISNATTTSHHFTGLASNTTYYVSVRADCGGGDVSDWSNVLEFTTFCDIVVSLPYIENFDSYSTGFPSFPHCWSYFSTYTDFPPYITSASYSAPGSMCTYGDNPNEHIVITPQFDASISINTLQANFMYRAMNAAGGIVVGVMSDPTDASTFVSVQTINATAANTWIAAEVSFANYTGNGHFIAFLNNMNSYVYIDNLIINTIQTCLKPQQLTVTSTTGSSATLTWTEMGSATSWEIEYGPIGFTQGQGTIVAVNSNPFTLIGLSASTNYDAYVRANCGSTTSYWSLPSRFATLCGPTTVPYMENFDAYATNNSSTIAPDNYPNDPMPTCWDFLNRDDRNQVFLTTRSGCAVHGNCLLFKLLQSTPTFAILPEFVNDIRNLAISFYLRKDGVSTMGRGIFIIGYLTDPNDTSTFVPTYTIGNNDFATGMHHIQEITFDSAPIGSRIAFKCQSTSSLIYYTLDNVVVDLLPNCRKPHDVVASNATTNSIDVAWTEMGGATTWNIEYGPIGFTQGQGTVISANTNPFTVTGLMSSTLYDFYVRADCGAGETSGWSDRVTGVTDCDVIDIFPYTENFDATSNLPPCWENIDMTGNTLWNVITPNHGNVTSAHSGSHAAVFFQGDSGNETGLLLPPFDFTNLTNPVLTFWYSNQDWSHDIDELYVYCRSSESDPWTLLTSHTSGTSVWTFDSLALPNPSANYQIKFQAISNWGYGINLDDITVKGDNIVQPTTCDIPRSLNVSNITTTEVTATWQAGGSETNWNLQYKLVTDANWSSIPVSTPSYTFSNLTPNSQYQVRVQAACDATTTSDWTAAVYFTTEEEIVVEPCNAPTDLTATEINNHDITLSWTENGTATSWTIYYRTSGATTWNTLTVTTNPYTLMDLEGLTQYDIQVVANCADGEESEPSNTITPTTTNVGVNNYDATLVTVAPNPTTGVVKVQGVRCKIQEVGVYDTYGKLLGTLIANDDVVEVNLDQYAAGVYFLRVFTGNDVVTKRILKK